MATIGTFTRTENGFTGEIATLTIQARKITIAKESRGGDNAPSHRIFFNKAEIGAAWAKTSKDGRDYLSVKLDDPSFAAPLYANLSEAEDGSFPLIWTRPNGRKD